MSDAPQLDLPAASLGTEMAARLTLPGDHIRRGHRLFEVVMVAHTAGEPVAIHARRIVAPHPPAAEVETLHIPPEEIIRRARP